MLVEKYSKTIRSVFVSLKLNVSSQNVITYSELTRNLSDDIHRFVSVYLSTNGTQPINWHMDKHQSPHDCRSFFSSFLDRFGSKYRSNVTGIIYNDEMDDFDIPGHNIVDDISPSPFNFPASNKRSFSFMFPAILTNVNCDVQLVIGASGGKRISTAVSLACLMASYFEQEKTKGSKIHPSYRSDSQVYYCLVSFRSVG